MIMQQKSYLREAAVRVLLLILAGLPAAQLEQVLSSSTKVQELLKAPVDASSPEVSRCCCGRSSVYKKVCRLQACDQLHCHWMLCVPVVRTSAICSRHDAESFRMLMSWQ